MKKTVLVIGKYSAFSPGGIESVVRSWLTQTRTLKERFFFRHICFAKSKNSHNKKLESHFSETECKVNFSISTQPISFTYVSSIFKYFRTSDVIILHLPNVLGAITVSLLSLIYQKQIIIHWHSDLLINNIFLSFCGRLAQSAALRCSNRVLCTSQEYFEYSDQLRKFGNKVDIFPIFLDDRAKFDTTVSDTDLSKLGIRKPFVLSVGRLVDYKGFDILIKAFSQININADLVIVGSGPIQNELNDLIKDFKSSNKVHIISGVQDCELDTLYSDCNCFVLASKTRSEAFGIVLLEASMFGKPLITSDLLGSGMSRLNLDGKTGVQYKNNSPESLALALNDLMSNSDLLKEYGSGARKNFLENYSISLLEKKIYNLLK